MALAGFATQSAAAAEPAALEITLTGLRSAKGQVLVCVTKNPRAFPDCSKDVLSKRLAIRTADAASFRVDGLEQGVYAVSVIHDENGNGKVDTNLMIPREGFGFSRNPAIGFGPPRFASAQIVLGPGDTAHAIRMRYIL